MERLPESVVYERVDACPGNLVGGSGHPTSYTVDRERFAVTAVRDCGDGLAAYEFEARGTRTSEFRGPTDDTDDAHDDGTELLTGATSGPPTCSTGERDSRGPGDTPPTRF